MDSPIPIARCLVADIRLCRSLVTQRTDSQFAPSTSNDVFPAIRVGRRSHNRLVPLTTESHDSRYADQNSPLRPRLRSAQSIEQGQPTEAPEFAEEYLLRCRSCAQAASNLSIDLSHAFLLPNATFLSRFFLTGNDGVNEIELEACRFTHQAKLIAI